MTTSPAMLRWPGRRFVHRMQTSLGPARPGAPRREPAQGRFAILVSSLSASRPAIGQPGGGSMRTLITNGTIVSAEGATAAELLTAGETIARIGAHREAGGGPCDETSDPAGRWLIPGAIDVHTPMELP